MLDKLVRVRNILVRLLTGFDAVRFGAMQETLKQYTEEAHALLGSVEKLSKDNIIYLNEIKDLASNSIEILSSERDNISVLRHKLWDVRATEEYEAVFDNKKPLISVRIATYNKPRQLVDVAIASVLKQTYKNFEVIVVSDGPNKDTESALAKISDKRVRYVNLHNGGFYPEDSQNRWRVAGSPGMNMGAYLAKGEWIAPLDDDDEFSEDHLEKLLKLALSTKSEMVYGAFIQKNTVNGEENLIWSSPPEIGQFSFQGAMYMKKIDFFEYDEQSWVVREPGDWNLCRRMQLAGVKIRSTKDIIGTIYTIPYTHKQKT